MNGRFLSALLMLLVLFVACFVAGPALSGEHPWGSDRGDGGKGGGGDDYKNDTVIIPKDTVVTPDSTFDSYQGGGTDISTASWVSWLTCFYSAMSAAFSR